MEDRGDLIPDPVDDQLVLLEVKCFRAVNLRLLLQLALIQPLGHQVEELIEEDA